MGGRCGEDVGRMVGGRCGADGWTRDGLGTRNGLGAAGWVGGRGTDGGGADWVDAGRTGAGCGADWGHAKRMDVRRTDGGGMRGGLGGETWGRRGTDAGQTGEGMGQTGAGRGADRGDAGQTVGTRTVGEAAPAQGPGVCFSPSPPGHPLATGSRPQAPSAPRPVSSQGPGFADRPAVPGAPRRGAGVYRGPGCTQAPHLRLRSTDLRREDVSASAGTPSRGPLGARPGCSSPGGGAFGSPARRTEAATPRGGRRVGALS